MNKAIVLVSAPALALALAFSASADNAKPVDSPADGPAAVVYDANSAFEFLKTLAGDWERSNGDHQHGGSSRGDVQGHGCRKLRHGNDLSGRSQ